jgi:mitogen-activated protein kinase organizer 1
MHSNIYLIIIINDMIDTTCSTTMKAHNGPVNVVKYSNDGKYCMSGGQDRAIMLWNPLTGMNIKTFTGIHNHEVMDLAIQADNSKFASVGGDRIVFYTDVVSSKVVRRFMGHHCQINCVSFNKESNVLITGSYDATIRIWDLQSYNKKEVQVLTDFTDSVTSILVNEEEIIATCLDGMVRIYDIRIGQLTTQEISKKPLVAVDASVDYKYLLLSAFGSRIYLYDKSTGDIVSEYTGAHTCGKYKCSVKFSKNNKLIYTTSEDGDIIVYDILTKKRITEYSGHAKEVSAIDLHPSIDGELVSASFDETVKCWGHSV